MDDLKLQAKNEKGFDSLFQTVRIFSGDIGMEFGRDKCTTREGKLKSLIEFHSLMEYS